ncbi:hypothetical protein ORIO_20945 (plasmid) [Cereibacter azotoformans]|uniref:hypothetical protein n=1 Tax=Cereibacter azotoformans TaxID=43057 RepID=UPI001EECB2B8|nr:hypothetical protein [Cereibacter azotoformans]ULB12266.1 hypothetical protein ORIO_20945 [Cereibacter azotoformans]
MRLVTSAEEAVASIRTFQQAVDDSQALQERTGYARSWFVLTEAGRSIYAPSKWVGYVGLSADDYVTNAAKLDGRKTEAVLRKWFVVLPTGSEQHATHLRALSDTLARFGKTPSTECRFNDLAVPMEAEAMGGAEDRLLDLLEAVIGGLPGDARARLLKRLR